MPLPGLHAMQELCISKEQSPLPLCVQGSKLPW